MASILYNKLTTDNLDIFTTELIGIINKRKDKGFDDVTLNGNFMKGRDKTVLKTLSKALGDLGYENNLTDTTAEEFKISW